MITINKIVADYILMIEKEIEEDLPDDEKKELYELGSRIDIDDVFNSLLVPSKMFSEQMQANISTIGKILGLNEKECGILSGDLNDDGSQKEFYAVRPMQKLVDDCDYPNGRELDCGCLVYSRYEIMSASLGISCSDCYDRLSG